MTGLWSMRIGRCSGGGCCAAGVAVPGQLVIHAFLRRRLQQNKAQWGHILHMSHSIPITATRRILEIVHHCLIFFLLELTWHFPAALVSSSSQVHRWACYRPTESALNGRLASVIISITAQQMPLAFHLNCGSGSTMLRVSTWPRFHRQTYVGIVVHPYRC